MAKGDREENNHHSSGEPDPKADVVVALTDKGLSDKVASRLARRYSRRRVLEKIDYLEFLQVNDPEKVKNPVGWLRRAIEENYSAPDGFKSQAEQEAEAAEKQRRREQQARLEAEEEKRREEEHEKQRQAYAAWLAQMREAYGTSKRELELWPQVLSELKLQLPRATYQAWFPRTQLLALTDNEALIAVPNQITQEWLENRLAEKIKAALAGLDRPVEQLKFEVIKSDGGTG